MLADRGTAIKVPGNFKELVMIICAFNSLRVKLIFVTSQKLTRDLAKLESAENKFNIGLLGRKNLLYYDIFYLPLNFNLS